MQELNVIDVGCATYGGDISIPRLVQEFKPRYLVGLDPSQAQQNECYFLEQTYVVALRVAAWTEATTVYYNGSGLGGYVESEPPGQAVPAIDLAPLVAAFAPVILKIDAEGAEYRLLEHLMDKGMDRLVQLAWIEWHGARPEEKAIKKHWQGEMVDWRW